MSESPLETTSSSPVASLNASSTSEEPIHDPVPTCLEATESTSPTADAPLTMATAGPKPTLEEMVADLNLETYKIERYAYIDALLVFTLFCPKRGKNFYEGLILDPTAPLNDTTSLAISNGDGITIGKLCDSLISRSQPTRESCLQTADSMCKKFPGLFAETDVDVIKHLLLRYHLLNSDECPVRVHKTRFDGFRLSAGLKAIKPIPASTSIIAASSSLSLDELESACAGGKSSSRVHVIHSSQPGLGPIGIIEKKLLLGPIRFVKHDCQPNCQITPIPNSSAYTITTLRDIQEGESLTVSWKTLAGLTPTSISTSDTITSDSDTTLGKRKRVAECRCVSCCPPVPNSRPPRGSAVSKPTGPSTSIDSNVNVNGNAGAGASANANANINTNINANDNADTAVGASAVDDVDGQPKKKKTRRHTVRRPGKRGSGSSEKRRLFLMEKARREAGGIWEEGSANIHMEDGEVAADDKVDGEVEVDGKVDSGVVDGVVAVAVVEVEVEVEEGEC